MTYEEQLQKKIEEILKQIDFKVGKLELEEIKHFILDCKNLNLSVEDGLRRFEIVMLHLKKEEKVENLSEFEKNKRKLELNMPSIPDYITEEWLQSALKNDFFAIFGFSFADISNCTFGNISEETLRRVSISSYTKLPKKHPFNMDFSSYIDKDIQDLHNQGITGKGINVAVIDYGFSIIHDEVKECLKDNKNYCENNSFHGLVVTNNLAGKNLGVAPDANVYFYGITQNIERGTVDSISALKDIYNKNVNGANIRIVSISGYVHTLSSEFETIKEKLIKQGCNIIDAPTFGRGLTCINQRNLNGKTSYYYSEWQKEKENFDGYKSMIAVPFTGFVPLNNTTNDYQICGDVSYSWVIPRLSGMYALCLQLKPDMTLDELAQLIIETKTITEDGITLVNPKGIIERLTFELEEQKKL